MEKLCQFLIGEPADSGFVGRFRRFADEESEERREHRRQVKIREQNRLGLIASHSPLITGICKDFATATKSSVSGYWLGGRWEVVSKASSVRVRLEFWDDPDAATQVMIDIGGDKASGWHREYQFVEAFPLEELTSDRLATALESAYRRNSRGRQSGASYG